MKKILAILLVCFLTLSFVACGGGGDESSKDVSSGTSAGTSDKSEDSSADDSSEASADDSSDVTSDDSSVADSSDDTTSDDSGSEDEPGEVEFTNKYISWGTALTTGLLTKVAATDTTSLSVSKIDEETIYAGDVAVYTPQYDDIAIPLTNDYSDFAIIVFEYSYTDYRYEMTSFSDIGKGSSMTMIPNDGWVLVVHKNLKDKIDYIEETAKGTPFFPHGITINDGLNASIKNKTATVDGKISSSEYGKAIWELNPDSKLTSYEYFAVKDESYYATAEVYLSYDKDNLYLGVIVDSPYHENNLTPANAGSMWMVECIQVEVSALPATSDYMNEHWDWQVDKTSTQDNVIRQYGFAVNENEETLICLWQGDDTNLNAKAVCIRDDAAQKTYYEVAIPWSEIGGGDNTVEVKEGNSFGFSVSVNCGKDKTADDQSVSGLIIRDGGGILGINDWSKVPVITFD